METLSTPRLHLLPLSAEILRHRLDTDDFSLVLDLPDGSRTIGFGPQWPGAVLGSYEALLDSLGGSGPGSDGVVDLRYVAVDRDAHQAVAELGAKQQVAADGSVEIGYGVNEACRGRGLGTEAVGALVAAALGREDVTRVLAHTTSDNIASQRVLENTGFHRVGSTVEEGHGPVAVWERSA